MHGFSCFEEVQGAARCGIMLPDGTSANGIGRCRSIADFVRKANHSKVTILPDEDFPYRLEIEVNGARAKVSPSIWRSWTGPRFIEGIKTDGVRFYFLSNQTA